VRFDTPPSLEEPLGATNLWCPRCGTELPPGAAFCVRCGKRVPTTGSGDRRAEMARLVSVGVGGVVTGVLVTTLFFTLRNPAPRAERSRATVATASSAPRDPSAGTSATGTASETASYPFRRNEPWTRTDLEGFAPREPIPYRLVSEEVDESAIALGARDARKFRYSKPGLADEEIIYHTLELYATPAEAEAALSRHAGMRTELRAQVVSRRDVLGPEGAPIGRLVILVDPVSQHVFWTNGPLLCAVTGSNVDIQAGRFRQVLPY
jgi:hypothetical protein